MVRIVKPIFLGHFDSKSHRHAIYSCDIQPGGNRLATAGGDFTVKLWDLALLLGVPPEESVDSRALLTTLENHTKSVNIVRWSIDGKYAPF